VRRYEKGRTTEEKKVDKDNEMIAVINILIYYLLNNQHCD
jgi:hypothetical protein